MTKRIVILGAGFGGLAVATTLDHLIGRDRNFEITLINKENFTLFTPMLHEVAASDVEITHIVNPVRKLLKHVRFVEGTVDRIDLDARKVHVPPRDFEYDHLVLALGAVTNFYNLPGVQQHALSMKSLGDAIFLRNRTIELLEHADHVPCPDVRGSLLTFVVAGGGFAGVETMAGINDFVRESLPYYRHLKEEMLRMVMVYPGDNVLPELGDSLGKYAGRKLQERKVEMRGNVKVKSFEHGVVVLTDGTRISASTLVWTAGISVNPILANLGLPMKNGRIAVDPFCQVEGRPEIWALGDNAYQTDPDTGTPYPPTAQHAMRQGKVLAHNLAAGLTGRGKRQPFRFKTLGMLAAIGRRTGVAQILGHNFSGLLAWFMWRTIYLSKLPRFEKKVRVALDWTLDLFFTKDIVQFDTRRDMSHAP